MSYCSPTISIGKYSKKVTQNHDALLLLSSAFSYSSATGYTNKQQRVSELKTIFKKGLGTKWITWLDASVCLGFVCVCVCSLQFVSVVVTWMCLHSKEEVFPCSIHAAGSHTEQKLILAGSRNTQTHKCCWGSRCQCRSILVVLWDL